MTTAFYLISVLLAGLFCFFSSLNYAHMFQLEGYKPKGYLKWLMQYGFDTVLAAIGMAMLFVLSYLFQATLGEIAGIIVGFALLTAFAALGILSIRKFRVKDAKKPLVYTSRIKRLLICEGILIAALCCAGYFSGGAITGILVALAPLYVLLANAVNAPIEALIRRHYLRDAQKKLEAYPDLIKIGITGSYGKTSTKFILAAILSEKYSVCVPPSSYNTPMGLTRVIREGLKKEHQVLLAEMGAKHKGDIEELVELVHPRYGIITSVGPQHLETFGDIQTVAATKYELISGLPKDGIAFFPDDAGICKQLYDKTTMEKRLFALEDEGECDLFASDISCGTEGSSFIVRFRDGTSLSATTKLLGKHNILNCLACISLCDNYNIDKKYIKSALFKFTGAHRRFEFKGKLNDARIYDDYGHHPTEIMATAKSLMNKKYNESWVIFQPHTYSRTKNLLDDFAKSLLNFDHIIVIDIYAAREINTYNISSEDLVTKISEFGKHAIYLPDFTSCVSYLKENVKPDDIILTLGAGTVTEIGDLLLIE